MWPFSRKPERSSASKEAPAAPEIHFDWKGLPSIQRTIADHPLTVPTESFASDLSTHDDPRAVANPLGHQVSLEAPPGIVLGIARHQTRSEGPELVPRPHLARRPAVQRAIDESVASEPVTAQLDQMDVDESTSPAAPRRRLAASNEPLPSLQLMRVSPETEPRPLEPEIVMPSEEPHALTSQASEPVAETTALPSYPRLTLGQARRLGLGAPIKHVPETSTSVQRISEVSTRSVDSTMHPTSGIQEEKTPTFEPFFLDVLVNKKPEVRAPAPISRPQRIPLSVSRSTTTQPPETASPEPTTENRTPEQIQAPTSSSIATLSDTQAAVQRDAEAAESDDVPVQLTPMSPDAASFEPIAGPPPIVASTDPKGMLLADAPKGEAGEGEGEATSPLPLALGPSPKESEVSVSDREISSRSIESLDSAEPNGTAATDSMAPLVSYRPQILTQTSPSITTSVQRSTESTAVSTQRAIDTPLAGRMTTEAGIRRSLARSVASIPEVDLPSPAESSPSIAGGDVAAVVSPSPMTRPSFPTSLPLARPSPPVFVAAPSVQRSASTQASSPAEPWFPVQTSTALLEPETERASVSMQRVPAQEWTVSAQAEPAATGPSLVAGEASSSTPDANDESQMEDLAAKLYDRIRIRLRNELLVDRERAGFLTDLR